MKLFTLAITINFANNVIAQIDLPYLEEFSGTEVPNGWILYEPAGQQIVVIEQNTSAYEAPFESDSGTIMYNFFNPSGNDVFYVFSPVLNNENSKIKLSFDFAGAAKKPVPAFFEFDDYANHYLEVEYSIDEGETFMTFRQMVIGVEGELNTGGFTLNSGFTPEADQWGTKIMTLPAETNQVRFKGQLVYDEFGTGNYFYLDNISFLVCETDMPNGETVQYSQDYTIVTDLVVEGVDLKYYSDENGINELLPTTELINGVTYYITQTLDECESEALAVLFEDTAAVNDSYIEDLRIYPNPTNGILNIDTVEKISSIHVYNLLGQEIEVDKSDVRKLDLSRLSSGTYFIHLCFDNYEIKSMKILKK